MCLLPWWFCYPCKLRDLARNAEIKTWFGKRIEANRRSVAIANVTSLLRTGISYRYKNRYLDAFKAQNATIARPSATSGITTVLPAFAPGTEGHTWQERGDKKDAANKSHCEPRQSKKLIISPGM